MKNVLITGVSSGIGNTLTKLLVKRRFKIWGISRRKKLLEKLKRELQSNNLFYTVDDVTNENFWKSLIKNFQKKNFIPDVVIFNAAINKNDLISRIDLDILRRIMEVNFFSILAGIKLISETYKNRLHFITISSTSAFKGSYQEGIGYAASKGALSIAFESLFQKYRTSRIQFTTVFLGPVKTEMVRFKNMPPFSMTTDQVANYILRAINEKQPFYYYPKIAFIILKLMRLLPNQVFFKLWTKLQNPYIAKDSEVLI